MFSVYCSGHQHEVLLTTSNITGFVNWPDGIDVAWKCGCGTSGVWHTGARRSPVRRAAAAA